MEIFLPLIMAAVIGAVHFFGETIDEYTGHYNFFIVSFSAGFTVAYFFSVLLPETMSNSIFDIQNVSILAGFSMFYVLEELLYERKENLGTIKSELKEAHTVFISLYHVAIGMILVFLSSQSTDQLFLFFLPILIHTSVNSLAIKEMHEEMLERNIIKLMASLSSLVGVLLTLMLEISSGFLYTLFGFVGGTFIYIVIHDALDPRRERPLGFIAGVISFLGLLSFIL